MSTACHSTPAGSATSTAMVLACLPSWRWNGNMSLNVSVGSVGLSSLGNIIPIMLDGIAQLAYAMAGLLWQIIMLIVQALDITAVSALGVNKGSIAYKVDSVYQTLFGGLQSTGLLYLFIIVLAVYALSKALRNQHQHATRTVIRTFLILGLIFYLASSAATSISSAQGQSESSYVPKTGSPSWLMSTVQTDLDGLGSLLVKASASMNGNNVAGSSSSAQYCDAYTSTLETYASQASGSGLNAVDAQAVSAIWTAAYLPLWEDAQFGSSSNEEHGGTTPNATALTYCHYLEDANSISPSEQYTIFENSEGKQYQLINQLNRTSGSVVQYNIGPAVNTVTTSDGYAVPPITVTYSGTGSNDYSPQYTPLNPFPTPGSSTGPQTIIDTGQSAVVAADANSVGGYGNLSTQMQEYATSGDGGIFGPVDNSDSDALDRDMFAWAMCTPTGSGGWSATPDVAPLQYTPSVTWGSSNPALVSSYCSDWYDHGDGIYNSVGTSVAGVSYNFEPQDSAGDGVCFSTDPTGSVSCGTNNNSPSSHINQLKSWTVGCTDQSSCQPPIWYDYSPTNTSSSESTSGPMITSTGGLGWADPFAITDTQGATTSITHNDSAQGFFNAWLGFNTIARLMDSILALITSAFYLLSIGGLSAGVFLASIGVDVFAMFLLIILVAVLLSPKPTKGMTGRVIKVGLSLMGSQFVLASLMSVIIALIFVINSVIPAGGGLAQIFLHALAPLAALLVTSMLAKHLFGMPSILHPMSSMRIGMGLSTAMDKMGQNREMNKAIAASGYDLRSLGANRPLGAGGLGTQQRIGPTGSTGGPGTGHDLATPSVNRQAAAMNRRTETGLAGAGTLRGAARWAQNSPIVNRGREAVSGSRIANGARSLTNRVVTPLQAVRERIGTEARATPIGRFFGNHPKLQKTAKGAAIGAAAAGLGLMAAPIAASAAIGAGSIAAWKSYKHGMVGKAVYKARTGSDHVINTAKWYLHGSRAWTPRNGGQPPMSAAALHTAQRAAYNNRPSQTNPLPPPGETPHEAPPPRETPHEAPPPRETPHEAPPPPVEPQPTPPQSPTSRPPLPGIG